MQTVETLKYETPRTDRGVGRVRRIAHALAGGIIAASLVVLAGWASTEAFPNTSRGILRWPTIPAATTVVLAGWAADLFRSPRTRGWAVGLWVGSGFALTLFCFWAIGIGYFHWFVVP